MSTNLLKCFLNVVERPTITLKQVQLKLRATLKTERPTNPLENIISSKAETRYRKRNINKLVGIIKKNTEIKERPVSETKDNKLGQRKKVALLLGYCGTNYFGLQWNPNVKTIEGDLLNALLHANCITNTEFNNPKNKSWFQRSSRTDRGVSAARQVVSLKIPVVMTLEDINKYLPETIRVLGIRRVTKSFDAHKDSDGRTYSYTMPTYAFEPSAVTDEERLSYRITEEKIDAVNNVLSMYEGFKCCHNFTTRKFFSDPSSNRIINNFVIDDICVKHNMQFATLLVKGQSFMMHQIRKMVGLTICIVRGHTPIDTMERCFSDEKIYIPTAPGLGLVLEKIHYVKYNSKFRKSHDHLNWDKEEDAIKEFRDEHIMPRIYMDEIKDDSMGRWLEKTAQHSFDNQELNTILYSRMKKAFKKIY